LLRKAAFFTNPGRAAERGPLFGRSGGCEAEIEIGTELSENPTLFQDSPHKRRFLRYNITDDGQV